MFYHLSLLGARVVYTSFPTMRSYNLGQQPAYKEAVPRRTAGRGLLQKAGRLLLPALLAAGCDSGGSSTAELRTDTYSVYTTTGTTVTREVPEIIVDLHCKADDDSLRVEISYIHKLHTSFPDELDHGILDARPNQLNDLDTQYVTNMKPCSEPFPSIATS